MKTIVEHTNLKENLNLLLNNDYKYIIKANDKVFSNWGLSENKKHIQLIACETKEERDTIINDLINDNTFSYVNWYPLTKDYIKNIIACTRNKTYTIRNDWTRCFNDKN